MVWTFVGSQLQPFGHFHDMEICWKSTSNLLDTSMVWKFVGNLLEVSWKFVESQNFHDLEKKYWKYCVIFYSSSSHGEYLNQYVSSSAENYQ